MVGVVGGGFVICVPAYSQRPSLESAAQGSGVGIAVRAPSRSPDIISDNLDRVAASSVQILEVLNREPGLMVELKRLLAQDAGASGQLLEESDLTDVAVAERLRSDLHSRVLATRLLQRYGYLVPRVNPDSDLGAEQKLVRQGRAQILARSAERSDRFSENYPAGQNAACDPRLSPECAFPASIPEDRGDLSTRPSAPARAPRSPASLQRATDVPANDGTRLDGAIASPNQRAECPPTMRGPENLLTSATAENIPQSGDSPRIA